MKKNRPNRVRRFIVQQLLQNSIETLFGSIVERKWKRVTALCFTYKEALYNQELLQKSDKFISAINNYRIKVLYI